MRFQVGGDCLQKHSARVQLWLTSILENNLTVFTNIGQRKKVGTFSGWLTRISKYPGLTDQFLSLIILSFKSWLIGLDTISLYVPSIFDQVSMFLVYFGLALLDWIESSFSMIRHVYHIFHCSWNGHCSNLKFHSIFSRWLMFSCHAALLTHTNVVCSGIILVLYIYIS